MAAVTDPHAPAGIDSRAVTEWLGRHVRTLVPPLRFQLVAGGRSNLTFRVEDSDGRTVALRRPPLSHVLPTAHDMAREYRILRALWPSPVPVPQPLGLCEDAAVTGSAFYVMSFVDGLVLRDAAGAEQDFSERTARHHVGMALADTLAALHAVDVDAVGLGTLARREGYVERQIRRWSAQFGQSCESGTPVARKVAAVSRALAARLPTSREVTLVHGDFRLDNTVVRPDGTVAAVLDWELSTLGDPMADVGTFLDYWGLPEDGGPILGKVPASALEGFPSRQDVLTRYATASGRDVSTANYFMAFGYWRLACILQGVYSRYAGGAAAGDPESVDDLPATVVRLADLAATTLGTL